MTKATIGIAFLILCLCCSRSVCGQSAYVHQSSQTLRVYLTNADDTLWIYRTGSFVVVSGGSGSGLFELIGHTSFDRISVVCYDGDDTVDMGSGLNAYGVSVFGMDGDDKIFGSPCNGFYAVGGNGQDVIHGTDGFDMIYGDDGLDVIYGYDGDDWLYAGSDYDTDVNYVFGGDGDDHIVGGSGSDFIWGGFGDDDIYGRGGPDYLAGESGNDRLMPGINGETYELYVTGNLGADEFHVIDDNGNWYKLQYGTDYNPSQGDTLRYWYDW